MSKTKKKKKEKERLLLIDGDILIYRAAFLAETPIDWGCGLWTLHARLDDAIAKFASMLRDITRTLDSTTCVIAVSDAETNFRKEILPTYKANRRDKRPPILRGPLRDYVLERYEATCYESLEGDDVLGILQTSLVADTIIVTIDKDLLSIPGTHYNMDKGELVQVSDYEADFNFMLQTLTGDIADGYSGCPGIGKVKAARILTDTPRDRWWGAVVSAYKDAGLTEGDALTQARVARILRYSDYDIEEKRLTLWTPYNNNNEEE
jgi:DNA polymerase-1